MEAAVRQVTRRLHEEHVEAISLCSRLEAWAAGAQGDAALLRAAAAALAGEVERHFAFEESALFPRLAAAGEGDLVELLLEEHASVRAAARRFIAAVTADASDPGLKPLALEVAERLASHAQKEEMSLLPTLDNLLDEGTDYELACAYAAL
jgi:hemerythrin-like domain-containing protein